MVTVYATDTTASRIFPHLDHSHPRRNSPPHTVRRPVPPGTGHTITAAKALISARWGQEVAYASLASEMSRCKAEGWLVSHDGVYSAIPQTPDRLGGEAAEA